MKSLFGQAEKFRKVREQANSKKVFVGEVGKFQKFVREFVGCRRKLLWEKFVKGLFVASGNFKKFATQINFEV